MTYRLSDEVLAAIARSVQVGILTGTDIVDHLRLIEVEQNLVTVDAPPAQLVLTADCRDRLQRNIDDLLNRAKELAASSALE